MGQSSFLSGSTEYLVGSWVTKSHDIVRLLAGQAFKAAAIAPPTSPIAAYPLAASIASSGIWSRLITGHLKVLKAMALWTVRTRVRTLFPSFPLFTSQPLAVLPTITPT
jgi:hypothetical protein